MCNIFPNSSLKTSSTRPSQSTFCKQLALQSIWLIFRKRCSYLSLLIWIVLMFSSGVLYVMTRSLVVAIICCEGCSRGPWVTIGTVIAIAIITLLVTVSCSFSLLLLEVVGVAVVLLTPVVVAGIVVWVVGRWSFWILIVLLIPWEGSVTALTLNPLILWGPK